MSGEIIRGNAIGVGYSIHAQTGTVTNTETRSKTEVSGQISGGGGSSYNGTGYNAPVSGSVESTTTDYQDIFLTDADGVEHLIQTENFLIPCRTGQTLTLLFVLAGRDASGPYFSAYNHNSRQTYDHPKALRGAMFPWRTTLIALVVTVLPSFVAAWAEEGLGTALFTALIVAAAVGFAMWIVGSIWAAMRAAQVRANGQLKQFRAQLANQPVAAADNPQTV